MAATRNLASFVLEGGGGESVEFARLLASHGVATLAPQRVDHAARAVETTLSLDRDRAVTIRISEGGSDSVSVDAVAGRLRQTDVEGVLARVRWMLNLDEDLSPFYELAARDESLAWATKGAGRMLRAPTVFEDVVKTVCTTNCAWSATIRMVNALVDHLGTEVAGGGRAFPSPEGMASAEEDFYRDVARAGYRGTYLIGLARLVVEGAVDLEGLVDRDIPDEEVEKRLLALPGVGPYAAAHVMLISLGRYRRLVLDSWTRPTYGALAGAEATDKEIVARFADYGDWAGLAFWLFLTRDWVDESGDVKW